MFYTVGNADTGAGRMNVGKLPSLQFCSELETVLKSTKKNFNSNFPQSTLSKMNEEHIKTIIHHNQQGFLSEECKVDFIQDNELTNTSH